VHEMILRLPAGYQTKLGDGATMLSAGQQQQIALARAFYGDPKVFVLDNPSAHLDQAGEGQLFNALMAAKRRGAAVFVVSRRGMALNVADRAYLMREGRLEPMPLPPRQAAVRFEQADGRSRPAALAAQNLGVMAGAIKRAEAS